MSSATIAPAQLAALVDAGTTIDLIDVRTAGEFAAIHAAGAIHRPLAGLDPARILAERKAPAGDPIYLICASGRRSLTAAEAFARAGFDKALSVSGGTEAWEAAGLTVVCAPASVPLGRRRGVLPAAAILALIALWIAVFAVPHPPPRSGASTFGRGSAIDFAQAVIAASMVKPVVVDYYAPWCAPCKQLAPELDAVLAAQGAAISVVRIDTDANQALAHAQGITGIPTVQLWRNGRDIAHFTGSMARADIGTWLERGLARH